MTFIIENQKIGLKRTSQDDIVEIIQMENEDENLRFIISYDKVRHLDSIISKDEEHFAIWDKEDNQIIGFLILAGLQNLNLSLEFRRIVVKVKGRGIGRQCLKLIKAYCFQQLKFHRLWLDVFEGNHRAIYLYKSEGFKEEGKLREVIKQGENFKSLFVLSILKGEYFEN